LATSLVAGGELSVDGGPVPITDNAAAVTGVDCAVANGAVEENDKALAG
jgi:hypothetical protein